MDRFETMRVFVRVMERQSFTRAAEDLALPRATVTQAVKQLEARLGARLLQRTTRQVHPTLDGEAYYRRCLQILADVEEADGAFRQAEPRGLLRVDVHGALARHFLLPGLPDFLARHPRLELRMTEGDRLVDLVGEGVDCVVRVGALRDSTMIARRIGLLDEVTVASPDYLARHGLPRHPDDLDGHVAVNFLSSVTGRPFPFEFGVDGTVRLVTLPSVLTVNGADTFIAACLGGLGLIQSPRYHVDGHIAAGRLVPVLQDWPPPPSPVSLLYAPHRHLSARLRVFADWVQDRFARPIDCGH